MTPSKTLAYAPTCTNPPMTGPRLQTPMNTPAHNGTATNRSQGLTSAPAALGDTTVRDGGDSQNPSIPGVFEHIHDVQTASIQPHSDSWPKPTDVPPNVLQRARPPLGKMENFYLI